MKSKAGVWIALIILSVIIGLAAGFFISKAIAGERIKELEGIIKKQQVTLEEYKNDMKTTENSASKTNEDDEDDEDDGYAWLVPDGSTRTENLASIISDETGFAVSRIDSSKDWVYDAPYEKNVVAESYTPDIGEKKTTTYAKDIVVPYININSADANVANSEIKSMFDEIISTYNKQTYHIRCGYEKHVNDSCLSVYAASRMGVTDIGGLETYTFNIDLKTGKKMSYSDVYKSIGFDDNKIEAKVEAAITEYMRSNQLFESGNAKFLIEEAINNYKQSVKDNTIKYYLSENGNLRIIVEMRFMLGFGGCHSEIVTID